MNLEIRKKELSEIALDHHGTGAIAYQLVNDFCLDKAILKITDVKTKTICKSIHPKGYLTGNEQFIDVLCEFIHYFIGEFTVIGSYTYPALACMLEDKAPKFLLCKNYWGNNVFIPYYLFNMKKLIIENFYDNIKFVYYEYGSFFKEQGITNRMSLRNSKSVDKIFDLLKHMVWCNRNQYHQLYLFTNYKTIIKDLEEAPHENKTTEDINKYVYSNIDQQMEILIMNYKKYIESVNNYLEFR